MVRLTSGSGNPVSLVKFFVHKRVGGCLVLLVVCGFYFRWKGVGLTFFSPLEWQNLFFQKSN